MDDLSKILKYLLGWSEIPVLGFWQNSLPGWRGMNAAPVGERSAMRSHADLSAVSGRCTMACCYNSEQIFRLDDHDAFCDQLSSNDQEQLPLHASDHNCTSRNRWCAIRKSI